MKKRGRLIWERTVWVMPLGLSLLLCGCGETTPPRVHSASPKVSRKAVPISRAQAQELKRQAKRRKHLAEDEALYTGLTTMLGTAKAESELPGANNLGGNEAALAGASAADFRKKHHLSEARVKQVIQEGQKLDWHSGFEDGYYETRISLRNQGFKFPGDF